MRTPVQEQWWPDNACFGCGPQNPHGLHLHSYQEGERLVATWEADPRFQGPPGVVNGGMVSVPMDCHGTWTAMLALMRDRGLDTPVLAVTAGYAVTLKRPTPVGATVALTSEALSVDGRKVKVRVEARVEGELTATFEGTFVSLDQPLASSAS